MAQIGRTLPTSATPSVAGDRLAAGARNVATVDRVPVEEITPKLGAYLDDGAHLFHGFERGRPQQAQQPGGGHVFGTIKASSQSFAAFLEFERADHGADADVGGGPHNRAIGTIARAINVYETNARVTSGAVVRLGKSLSLTL